ncbi:hypothetical protein [Arthrobacter sp. H41]|uniref:hypothetical protein n=1 Tax=Arthrobacter sp. H41 TaxID=1312978 RepID=UPI00047EE280|nr:hypothetical protein [Arthrobacter sp. H41]
MPSSRRRHAVRPSEAAGVATKYSTPSRREEPGGGQIDPLQIPLDGDDVPFRLFLLEDPQNRAALAGDEQRGQQERQGNAGRPTASHRSSRSDGPSSAQQ